MTTLDIAREIETLPPEAQRQVTDFVAFLKTRYPRPQTKKRVRRTKLVEEPFIGMWLGREDMQDSSAWVRDLRRREWERDS